MGDAKWTLFSIGYQTGLAYILALIVYQLGMFFTGQGFGIWTAIAVLALVTLAYLVVRPMPEKYKTEEYKAKKA